MSRSPEGSNTTAITTVSEYPEPNLLTSGEIKACLAVASSVDPKSDLPDPIGFADLVAQPDRVVATIRDRFLNGRTPLDAQVFRWPKNRKGTRPMAVLDPFDRVAYRAMVGRHVDAIAASSDSSVVLSSRLAASPPGWRVEPYGKAIEERRNRGLQMFAAHGVLATLDIKEYFPSVTRNALEVVFGELSLHRRSFDGLLDWLDALHVSSAVTGLPIGPGGSEILGNGLLVPGDRALATMGLPFLRYMDDTWLFLASQAAFGPALEVYAEVVSSDTLGLVCHPEKCKALDPFTAMETIQRSAIQYAHMQFADPELDDEDTAQELFDHAMWCPDERCPEMRMALGRMRPKTSGRAFDALVADPSLIALAPGHWRTFLRSLLRDRQAAKRTSAPDWVLEQVTCPVSDDNAYIVAVLLQAASAGKLRPSKADGDRILDAARLAETASLPVQAGAAHLWSNTDSFKPNVAVEAAEAAAGLAAKRSYAVALNRRRGHAKMTTWVDGVRESHPDLDATAEWLLAA